ncbi:putative glycosidase [Medicago truncatula]|uniref:Glycoside hydrolase family 79 amino-terminal domain protein n=1 Tax=Medicago truncatula TaxID=3880 RepID=G7JXW9_MEDTR|nr:heparanase-like protein 2 [Medicago truncatula]AES96970.2 glycoside hydrolase family 79 amino-terminal domain protein [Medicago truncatula]RHN55516.1 putative glycosidase [Medicago truncatula]
MDVKALFYILLLLFTISSAEDVLLNVKGVTNIATTDNNFICATLDWWPENKCDYNQCPWGKAGILNLDLGNRILSNAVKAFNPLRIRLGGSLQDQIIYQFGSHIKRCPNMIKIAGGLFGFSKGCLPQNRWDQVNDFFNKNGVKLTFGLNALIGKNISKVDNKSFLGDWRPANAISLMKYTISKGYKIDSYELGNELCGEGIGARVDSVQYAKDITKLRSIVNRLYPDVTTRPKVVGPAGFYDREWFDTFLHNVRPGVVDGVTHHIYNLGAGVDKELINRVQDPYFLSQIGQTFKDVAVTVRQYTPRAGAWVGEAGGAYNSGGKDVSHTFVNGFWYLDQLGMTATMNHKVYCRQTLIGGNYGLLNTTSFIPNPDYYGALLFNRLMGPKVLSISHEASHYLRTYAHCSKNGPGITVLIINMAKTIFNLSIMNDMNKQMREEYHLTPKDGNIQSDVVLLNGTPLMLTRSLDIPLLKPVLVSSSSPIKVDPQSIVFVQLKGFNAPACV